VHAGFCWGNLWEREHLEDLGIYRRIIYSQKCMLEELNEIKDWIDLAEDRDSWRALGNAVITLAFHKMLGIS
jgi:hypothetical protein